jgi:hypothetical protein
VTQSSCGSPDASWTGGLVDPREPEKKASFGEHIFFFEKRENFENRTGVGLLWTGSVAKIEHTLQKKNRKIEKSKNRKIE